MDIYDTVITVLSTQTSRAATSMVVCRRVAWCPGAQGTTHLDGQVGALGPQDSIMSQIFTNILLCTPPDPILSMEQEVWHPVSLLPLVKSFNLIGWSECICERRRVIV